MEHKLTRQCSIGCLGRLNPEQFKKCKWAFPAFGIPKKNGTVQFVIDTIMLGEALFECEVRETCRGSRSISVGSSLLNIVIE